MDVRQLGYFVKIAQEESFSEAALRLGVSQPTLSLAIKGLEEELGVKLFYPFGRKQYLTDSGRRLYTRAQDILDGFRETYEAVRSGDGELDGTITIGMPPVVGTCYFTAIIADFKRLHPKLEVRVVEQGALTIEDMIEEGTIDIACTIGTPHVYKFGTKDIVAERNVVLVPSGHALAKNQIVSMEELKDEPFAIFNENFVLHVITVEACKNAGFTPKFAVQSSQWDFLVELVREGLAISILPEPIIRRFPLPGITCLELDESAGLLRDWTVLLIWNKNRYFSNACAALLEHVENRFGK
ncbi:MAG: LysR family transcriptional regulator [Oscillospiraceae bacterium]|nr:LysR family transcriptional regulator [Oscillospiraceae bacterium]